MKTDFQIDLFGQIIDPAAHGSKSTHKKDKLPAVRWSFSKRNLLESCLRKYFYRYYAGKLEADNIEKFLSVKFLKSLSNQHLVGGKIIHNLIRQYLTKAKTGSELTTEWLKTMARAKIKESLEYTQAVLAGKEIKLQFPPFILQEMFYDNHAFKEVYQGVEYKVIAALENFMMSPTFEDFRVKGKIPGSYVEKRFSIPLTDQITVTGEADLAYQHNEYFEINDWKTGKVEDGDDSMQLLTYTLWAIELVGIDQNKIKIFKSYLNEDEKKVLSLSERDIFRNKLAIRQSAEAMLEIHSFGEAGDEQAFTPCRQEKICSMCPFQKICN